MGLIGPLFFIKRQPNGQPPPSNVSDKNYFYGIYTVGASGGSYNPIEKKVIFRF